MALQSYPTLNDAIALAKFAHFKQRDQAGMPYIDHPLRVLERAKGRGARPYVLAAAVLHDVPEDTRFTIPILREIGIPEPTLIIVDLLDRTGKTDEQYYGEIRENEEARRLKLDDIGDNRLPWRMHYLAPAKQQHLNDKYDKAERMLAR